MKRFVLACSTVFFVITASGCSDAPAVVPDVVGLNPEEAVSLIEEEGYEIELTEEVDADVGEARVTAQDPQPDTELDPEELVHIIVSTPPPPVPDVVGLSQENAESALEGAGFDVEITEEYQDGAVIGEVIAQRPVGGTSHDPERPVQVTTASEFLSPEVSGYFVLLGDSESVVSGNGGCEGARGYDDIHPSAQVVVRNESGTVLATTALGEGTHLDTNTCIYEFTLDSLPRAQFYSIEISRRGELTYSREELEANDWMFEASLGSP